MKKTKNKKDLLKPYIPQAVEDTRKKDFEKLNGLDQILLDEIDARLKNLSPEGREYWQTYYN